MATIQPNTFVPTSISGCTLWLDAADTNSLVLTGNTVSQWSDKSGSNNNATAQTGTTTYSGNGVVFTGAQMFQTPLSAVVNTQSVFFIFSTTGSTGYQYIVSVNSANLNTGYNYLLYNNQQSISRFGGVAVASGSTVSTNTRLLYNATVNGGGNSFVYLNGTQSGSGSSTPSVSGTNATVSIGAYLYSAGGPTPLDYFSGTINEILIYSTILTQIQRQQIEGYLAWKWGLQTSLPSTHPFRYLPPNSQGLALTLSAPISLPSQSMSPSSSAFFFFRPTTITGCVLWLDANDPNGTGIQPANNATVSTWTDKSGIANNGTGATATFQLNRQNALPGVYFGGGTSYTLAKPGAIPGGTTTSATFFAVFSGSGNDAGILAQTGAAGVACDKTGRLYYINTSGGAFYSTLYCGAAQVSTSYTLNTPFLLSDTYVNTGSGSYNHFAWSSGTSIGSAGVSGVNTGNATVRIGDNLVGAYFTGYMYELIMFAAALTDAQRQQVEGYLAWKWGLNGQLPASHPFKTTLPGLPIAIPGTRVMQQASFRPSQISGLQLWLDGQDPNGNGTVPANGSTIYTWTDKSGAGNSATSGTAVTYNTTGISNYPVMSFTGAPSYFSSTDLYSNRSFSVYIVCRRQAANSVAQAFIGGTTLANNQNMIILFGSATAIRFAFYGNDLDATIPAYTGNTSTEPTFIFAFTYTPGSRNISINGTLSASDANTTNLTASLGERIGAWATPNTTNSFNGFIGEILVYNGVPTTAQRQSVEGYLAWKWNLVSNLPATHPFKKFPPPPN